MKELNNQINFVIKPLAIFVLVCGLLLFTILFGVGKIVGIRNKVSESRKMEVALSNKIQTLRTVDTKIADNLTYIDVALPSRASALYAMNQIKVRAIESGVVVSNLRSGNSVSGESSIDANLISFDVDGNILSVYNFLESFAVSLPIMNVTKARINLVGDVAKANISLNVYSSALPKKIPSVTTSVNGLTPDEESLLSEISKYDLPSFIEPKATEGISVKEDPFN